MKALLVDGPGSISLVERPIPDPGPGEVRVDVRFANICHTDHFIVGGVHPTAIYPIVPGHELSGVISAVGSKVDPDRLGEHITVQTQLGDSKELGSTVDGGWQESIVIPASAAIRLPPEVSLLEGSLTEPSANGYSAVSAADIKPGDTVVVIGPGPIGLLALQHARLRDPARLILVGLETDANRLALGSRVGATDIVATTPSEGSAAVMAVTSGHGADVVIQCAGSISATAMALRMVADRGRILIEGYAASRETVEVSPDELAVRELRIRGVRGWTEAEFRSTLELHKQGAIQLDPLVSDCYPIDDYEKALARSLDYAGGAVKVCFAIGGGEAGGV